MDLTNITLPLKKRTKKNNNLINIEEREPIKPKRKYTRKILPKNIDITLQPISTVETPVVPPIELSTVSVIKPKRKYTRKTDVSQKVLKPKRKYTRKAKLDVVQEQTQQPILKLKSIPELNENPPIIKNIEEYKETSVIPTMPKIKKPKLKITTDTKPFENIPVPPAPPVPLTGSQKPPFFQEKKDRLNESLVELMDDLSFIMRKRKDVMRARAYNNAKETIQTFEGDITNPTQLKGKSGIGSTIYQKIEEYVSKGTLDILEKEKANILKRRAMEIFTNIYGIGEKKAEELIEKGITTLDQLKQNEMTLLNDKQRIGLKYYHDILERIPRDEIVKFENIFKQTITSEITNLKMQIVGSYRRGLSSSGDIDVILTSENPRDFSVFVDNLLKKNIILEVLSRGTSKCLVIAKLPESQYARRVDFLYTSPKEFAFSILYFTGSKEFNTSMREHALSMKYTLNEHGISYMEGKTKKGLVEQVFPDEKSIFDFLKLQYKNPEERIGSKAVVPLQLFPTTFVSLPIPEPVVEPKPEPVVEPKPEPVVEPKPEPQEPEQNIQMTITKIPEKRRITKKKAPKILEPEPPAPSINITQEIEKDTCKVTKKITMQNINNFKLKGVKLLDDLDEEALSSMIDAANTAFHCTGKPIMTDAEFDILREYTEQKFPGNTSIKNVGAPIKKNKAVLPYEMWSMDKIKPDTNALDNWKQKYKGPYVISCKLDGISVLYTTEGKEPKMYTRGNGKVGEDISYLIPFVKLPKEKNLVIRGEFVMKRKIFEEKYKNTFANSRNMVAGIVNKKNLDKNISDVDFVAYELIKPNKLQPSKQFAYLNTLNIDVVQYKTFTEITNEFLSNILQDWRTNSIYDIDGIIVSNDMIYPRVSGNPEHSFAFKMVLSDQIAETHVIGVEWNVSKDGYLKPRIHLEPIRLGGVNIEYTTGFNGDFISKNKIGVGAIVKIIRSGDVIPYIKEVTKPAENAMMPTVPYVWNDTHVDILLENMENDESVKEKQIIAFFKTLSVDGIGPGNVKKIMGAGFDSVPKILHMTEADFLAIGGFQQKMAKKLVENILSAIERATLVELMAGSTKFGRGFGTKKIEAIMEAYPNVLDQEERKIDKIAAISGMSITSAQDFVDRIPLFLDFMRECGLEEKIKQKQQQMQQPLQISIQGQPTTQQQNIIEGEKEEDKEKLQTIVGSLYNMIVKPFEVDTTHPLYGKTIVISGFTDKNKELENKLKFVGAKMGSAVSKKTSFLVVKSEDEKTGKWVAATEYGIPIYTLDKFMEKFFKKEGIEHVDYPV